MLANHLPRLHAFVHVRLSPGVRARESSMDLVQSVCRDLLSERDRFEFRGEASFRAWLFTAALNKIRAKYRFHHRAGRDPRKEEQAPELDLFLANHLASPSQDAMSAERARIVQQAIDALGEDHREVITLARLAGLPHKVIAEVMGRSEEATRQLLGRAIAQFAVELQRRGIREP